MARAVSGDEGAGGRLDVLGAAAATLGLGGVVHGPVEGGGRGFKDAGVAGSLAAGVVLLVIFVVVEHRRGRGTRPLRVTRGERWKLLDVCGFRVVVLICAALALVSGLFAWRLIG